MAGAGYKLFSTGDVLSASDVNTYLMQQTVMSFASSAARTTALASVLAEGMVTYLQDTNVVEIYTGASWVSLDDPNAIQNSIVDAKGDIITATADNTPARLAVGTNGQTLVADSSTATGLAWATPSAAGFVGARAYDTTGTTVSTSTFTAIPLASETFDTNTFHDNATNNSRMTIPTGKAGYYQIEARGLWGSSATGFREILIYKNGTSQRSASTGIPSGEPTSVVSCILNLAVGDYIQMYVYQTSGGNLAFYPNNIYGGLTINYLGA